MRILLDEHKKLRGMIGKVSQSGLAKNMNNKTDIGRNGAQIMDKLKNIIDPKMMSQLGGQGNLMNMMKEMSNNPQMEEMMKSLGGGAGKKKVMKVKK